MKEHAGLCRCANSPRQSSQFAAARKVQAAEQAPRHFNTVPERPGGRRVLARTPPPLVEHMQMRGAMHARRRLPASLEYAPDGGFQGERDTLPVRIQ